MSELQALACADCPAQVTVQRGRGGPNHQLVLIVYVVHSDDCPWSRVHVVVGGATLYTPGGILRHVRAGDPDFPSLGV